MLGSYVLGMIIFMGDPARAQAAMASVMLVPALWWTVGPRGHASDRFSSSTIVVRFNHSE